MEQLSSIMSVLNKDVITILLLVTCFPSPAYKNLTDLRFAALYDDVFFWTSSQTYSTRKSGCNSMVRLRTSTNITHWMMRMRCCIYQYVASYINHIATQAEQGKDLTAGKDTCSGHCWANHGSVHCWAMRQKDSVNSQPIKMLRWHRAFSIELVVLGM